MNIDIQSRDFSLTTALRRHIRRRLDAALGVRIEQIHRIQVRLSDINGCRGGPDKRCLVHVVLPQQRDVIVEDIEQDMYVAIDRAAERVGNTVNRRLNRRRLRVQRATRHRPGMEAAIPATP